MMRNFLLLLIVSVFPAVAADITGKWSIDGSMNGNPISFDCTFEQKEHTVTGSCKGYDLASPVTGAVSGEGIRFSIVYNFAGVPYTCTYTGRLTSDTELKGSVTVAGIDGSRGEFTGKKS
jgi:hypothetical protein